MHLFSLFKQYVLQGTTYEMLSIYSGYSVRHLQETFVSFLTKDPPALSIPYDLAHPYLLIDGLWFGRWFVLMVYRQSKALYLLHISTAKREVSTRIKKDLLHLKGQYTFKGVVSDGGTGITSAVHEVFRFTPHQICMAHMHRQVVSSIGKRSSDYRVQELRALADHLWRIESKEALLWWRQKLTKWITDNKDFLEEYRWDRDNRGWYVHKGVRKAVRILRKLPQTSFKFLDYPLMPKTTNEIEASFGHLYRRWIIHRGLKRQRWQQFLRWFVYFYNEKKLSQRKA
jgi:hypothetical protein